VSASSRFDFRTFEKRVDNEGLAWEMKEDFTKALEAYDRLLKEAEAFPPSSGKDAGVAYLLLRKGGVLLQTGKVSEGERLMRESLASAERSGYGVTIGRAKLGLGVFCGSLGRFEEAERLLTETFLLFSKDEDFDSKQGAGWSLLNLGGLYGKQGKWFEAEQNLDKAIEVLKSIKNWVGVASAYELKAKNSLKKGETARAKEHYAKAIDFYKKQGMKEKADSIRKELKKTNKTV
jgi:tetratricopeptide (TPR) repeat protein